MRAGLQSDCEVEAISGETVVNAKSLLGVMSLNIDKPIELSIKGEHEQVERFIEDIRELVIA